MGLGSRIIHLMGLQGYLMIWVDFPCWIIDELGWRHSLLCIHTHDLPRMQ